MRKLILFIATMVLLAVSCTESKKIDSPIMGEYDFGFVLPEQNYLGALVFNSDGSVDGVRGDNGSIEKKVYTFTFEKDSILSLIRSYNGDKTETRFVVVSEPGDTVYLRMKSKIRYMGEDAPAFMKKHTNAVPIVEYDSQSDSTLVVAVLIKK